MRFVGIDLAWSVRKAHLPGTGGVALDDAGRVIAAAHLTTDGAIRAFILEHTDDEGCVVGIDAPLAVPNLTGRRACEAALHAAGIPCYPANRTLFDRTFGGARGELLAAQLAACGFQQRATLRAGAPTRAVLEVYPRALITRLFGSIPRYKAPRGATAAAIGAGLLALQALMLTQLEPPLVWNAPPVDPATVGTLRPSEQKRRGDLLDAALAAYLCFLTWRDPARVEAIGTVADGFIMLPRVSVSDG